MTQIVLKRVYEPYQESDGYRILVDRLWPRGIRKENAHIDLWLKEIAPSTELRNWFGHQVENWPEFEERYLEEITKNTEACRQLSEVIKEQRKVTILFGAKDEEHNQAVVLSHWIHQNQK